jgi:hypothetical protein
MLIAMDARNVAASLAVDVQLLFDGLMIVRKNARHLPHAILIAPHVRELRNANAFVRGHFTEAMFANGNRAVILDRIHAQRSRHQFAAHLVANEFLGGFHDLRAREHQARVVVKKLNVGRDEIAKAFEVALVVRIEHFSIKLAHFACELVIRAKRYRLRDRDRRFGCDDCERRCGRHDAR